MFLFLDWTIYRILFAFIEMSVFYFRTCKIMKSHLGENTYSLTFLNLLTWISLRICSLSHVTMPSKNSAWLEGEVIAAPAAMTCRRPAHQWPKRSKKSYTLQNLRYLSKTYTAQPALWKLAQQFTYGESLYLYTWVSNKLLVFHHHPGTCKPRFCTIAGALSYQFCKTSWWWPKL